MSDIKYFFLKLNPPRSSFSIDMTDVERSIMVEHVLYWTPYVQDGTVLVLGPVADPKGGYGIAVIGVPDESVLKILVAKDPANGLCSYEMHPMPRALKK